MFNDTVFAYFGINPSTADETQDDQTVKKWIGFTIRNGGRRLIVGNAFAYRATDVNTLATTEDPVGPDNDCLISEIINEADVLVPCWGSRDKVPKNLHKRLDTLYEQLLDSGKPVKVFGTTKSLDPLHPARLAYETSLIQIN